MLYCIFHYLCHVNSVNKKTNKYLLPICFALTAVVGMGLGYIMNVENRTTKSGRTIFSILSTGSKMDEVLELIKDKYVEDIGLDSIEEVAVNEAVLQLDPHSNYIPAKELQAVNEPLEGNFEGIGVEFYLLKDTIYIVSAFIKL